MSCTTSQQNYFKKYSLIEKSRSTWYWYRIYYVVLTVLVLTWYMYYMYMYVSIRVHVRLIVHVVHVHEVTCIYIRLDPRDNRPIHSHRK